MAWRPKRSRAAEPGSAHRERVARPRKARFLDAALTLGTGAAVDEGAADRLPYAATGPQLGDSDEGHQGEDEAAQHVGFESARTGRRWRCSTDRRGSEEVLGSGGSRRDRGRKAVILNPGTTGAAVAAGGLPPAGRTRPSGPDSRGGGAGSTARDRNSRGWRSRSRRAEAQEKLYQFSLATKPETRRGSSSRMTTLVRRCAA